MEIASLYKDRYKMYLLNQYCKVIGMIGVRIRKFIQSFVCENTLKKTLCAENKILNHFISP
jgi:hypothetical protein